MATVSVRYIVDDVDAAIDFYCGRLGFEEVMHPAPTFAMLDSHALIRISWRQARRGDLAFFGREHVELVRWGHWTFGAEHTGTRIGFHKMNRFWHPTMYFRVR